MSCGRFAKYERKHMLGPNKLYLDEFKASEVPDL